MVQELRLASLTANSQRPTITAAIICTYTLARHRCLPQATLQIRREQLMKQLFARFAPCGESSCPIRARLQTALHRLADTQILILYSIADRHALFVVGARSFADIAEVEIENHPAMVHINRYHQIRIEIALVAVEHEIRMQPEIPGPVTSPRRSRGRVRVFVGTHHRT